MDNFIAYNPTQLHFGKNCTAGIAKTVSLYGKNILFLYGKGSVVKHGYYQTIKSQLEDSGLNIVEYSGIKSNPVIVDVDKAATLGIEKNIDVIVALGGGSVIDSAKIIGLSIAGKHKGWDIMSNKVKPESSIPVIAILTLAATGTEMNGAAVVQNNDTGQKIGYWTPLSFPKHSYLDPMFTVSVPKSYTAYGIVDLIAHSFEAYFGAGESSLSDRFIESIIKDTISWTPKVLTEPNDYEARANIMLNATCALNGIPMYGKSAGDWGTHSIGHILSLLFDTPHGASLSIAYPAWLRLQSGRIPARVQKLCMQLYGTSNTELGIRNIEAFFQSLGSPIRLSEIGITEQTQFSKILESLNQNNAGGYVHKLTPKDYPILLDLMK